MIGYRNIQVPSQYTTQGTYVRLPLSRKLTFVTNADLYCQVLSSTVDTFPTPPNSEFTVPAGYLSKTFYDGIYGLRFRAAKDGGVATVEFTLL